MTFKKRAGKTPARILIDASFALVIVVLSLATGQWEAHLDPVLSVGDHVEYVGVYKGVVTEIGTGSNAGCYRVRSDNAGNPDYKGDMVCTLGQPGLLYLLDRSGKRIMDINAPQTNVKGDAAVDHPKAPAGAAKVPTVGGDFHDGDRVEGLIGSTWYKCTVVGERRPTGGYVLRCDNRPLEESVFTPAYVRAMQGTDPDGKRIAAQAKSTIKDAAAQCSGEPLLNFSSRGRAASQSLFSDVIRSMFDKEGRGEKHLHKIVTHITSLEMGGAFRWASGVNSMLIPSGTTAYPVKASFVTCDDGPFDWSEAQYQNYDYVCYVDRTRNGEWSCGVNVSGTIKSVNIPKQSQNDLFVGKP
jgi:hypothetical protein